ncbi:hypothetical protein D7294_08140 [Streptomyces hoynatensis]|uniref:Uncharacterized protein n=1 Tax=Streptomyces hoynatensis TaxID=1141874 RepID=A0A3A9ZA15_9ACTN|nr:hypothetical protein D7294_08140 [Streptomyces hoynatensis]
MWFLAGTFGGRAERTCTVPPGTPIAFPLVNSMGEPEDCAEFMRTARGSAALDGTAVDPDRYPGTSVTFEGVPGNAVTSYGGSHSVTACGLWVQLPAAEPGRRTLTISGFSGDFAVAVDYVLLVPEDRTV